MIPCALLGFVGGAAYFGNLDVDPMKPIMVLTHLPVVSFCVHILVTSRVLTHFSFMAFVLWDVLVCPFHS